METPKNQINGILEVPHFFSPKEVFFPGFIGDRCESEALETPYFP